MSRFRFWRSVEDAASAEALASPLPGYYDGPADAYRHIVGTAEARRRYGFGTAYPCPSIAVMTEYAWPAVLRPSRLSFYLQHNTLRFVSPVTRATQVLRREGALIQ